jgi:predicted unusual protein kinase regulating ubiquinone biosynthesis (AarF/ABC1/UbiB family)
MLKTNRHSSLKQLRTGSLSRGISLARVGVRMGVRLGFYSLGSWLLSQEKQREWRQQVWSEQAQLLAEEFGQLKGSVMKVGQMLALYGEHLFLPLEVIEALRTLQDDSPPLEWRALQPVLMRELGAGRLAELEVDPSPLAAASLGQVHRARRLRDGRELCIKIQYPGVAEAIDSDLNTLEALLFFSRLLPRGFDLSAMMAEVRKMLRREIDYRAELATMQTFHRLLRRDGRLRIPEVFPEYSTACILTCSYEPGIAVDGSEAQALSQERRNRVGAAALELFLRELFRWNLVQTDPHFGNYRIRLDPEQRQDQLVLLDFGAVRRFAGPFLKAYRELVTAAFWRDKARLCRAAVDLNFMPSDTPQSLLDRFARLCFLIVEPFAEPVTKGTAASFWNRRGEYRWGATDLPQRVALAASKASLSLSFRLPPREFIFLHRKLGGVFVFLATLRVELNARC